MRKTQSVLRGRKYSSVIESWPPYMYKAMAQSPALQKTNEAMDGAGKSCGVRDRVGQGFCSIENEMLNK